MKLARCDEALKITGVSATAHDRGAVMLTTKDLELITSSMIAPEGCVARAVRSQFALRE